MSSKIPMLLAALAAALFIPSTMRACDGACGGGNNTNTAAAWHRHHNQNQGPQAGAGEGLNNGVNLSLDQSQQGHNNQFHNKNWAKDHKNHEHGANTNS